MVLQSVWHALILKVITTIAGTGLDASLRRDFVYSAHWDQEAKTAHSRRWRCKVLAIWIWNILCLLVASLFLGIFLAGVASDVQRDFLLATCIYLIEWYCLDSLVIWRRGLVSSRNYSDSKAITTVARYFHCSFGCKSCSSVVAFRGPLSRFFALDLVRGDCFRSLDSCYCTSKNPRFSEVI